MRAPLVPSSLPDSWGIEWLITIPQHEGGLSIRQEGDSPSVLHFTGCNQHVL